MRNRCRATGLTERLKALTAFPATPDENLMESRPGSLTAVFETAN